MGAVAPVRGQRLGPDDLVELQFDAAGGESLVGDEKPLLALVLGGLVGVT